MKILWFSNTPSRASKVLWNEISKSTGNWISSLEQEIHTIPDIELGIAFHKDDSNINQVQVIKNDSVCYYMVPKKQFSKIGRIYRNWFEINDEKYLLDHYLKVIDLFKPDVIHIFGFENSFISILKEHSNITIIHIQGIISVLNYFVYGGFSKFELLRATSILDLLKGNFYAKTKVRRFKKMSIDEANAFKSCKYLFGRTEWDKRVSKTMAPQAKYFHCHEIMREEFYENSWDKKRSDEIILYTTLNDIPYKGPDQIFYIDDILQKYHPSLKYRWRIAGLDETSFCIRAMRNKGFKKTKRLEFIGKLSAFEIIEEMKKSDLFIYTSWIENGCNAVQEAMLLGIPIVCTAAGGLSSTIRNRQTGLLVQPGDPYAMAGAILDLINDYEFAIKLGQNARSKAFARHNKRLIVETVILTYKEILGNT